MPPKKIAVIPFFDPDLSPSGLIVIPDQAKERSDQGMIKYVGTECNDLKEGDVVIFSGYSGKNLEIEGEGILIILDVDEVVACLEGDKIEATEVPGIYFKGKDGTFFPCNYEFAMTFISRAISDADWRRGLKSQEMFIRKHEENKSRKK